MRVLKAPLSVVVLAALLASPALPAAGQAGQPSAEVALGWGARFLPSESLFYLAVDPRPGSPLLDRLRAVFTSTPEAERESRTSFERLGLDPPLADLADDIQAWAGRELFIAIPDLEEAQAIAARSVESVDVNCREPGFLIGAAIGDPFAFFEFARSLNERLGGAGVETLTERHNGTEITSVRMATNPEASGVHLAIREGYLLLSPSRARLVQALNQQPPNSLAENPMFREALSRFSPASVAAGYFSVPADVASLAPGASLSPIAGQWLVGALTAGEETLRLDIAGSLNSEAMSPITRSLLGKAPNPLRTARVAPAGSSFFLSWHNLKALWDQVVESAWPDPQEYAQVHQQALEATGLNLDEDVFSWMTGEVALFVAPAREQPAGGFPIPDLGLVVEARDANLAQQKLDKVALALQRLNPTPAQATTETIAGVAFRSIPTSAAPGSQSNVFLGLAEGWAVLASSRSVAADVVEAARGRGGLHTDPEYAAVRSALPERVQSLMYMNFPELVGLSGLAALAAASTVGTSGPLAGPDHEALQALGIFRGTAIAYDSNLERIDTHWVLRMVIPEDQSPFPTTSTADDGRATRPVSVLIDLSRSGESAGPGDPRTPGVPSRTDPFRAFLSEQLGARFPDFVFPGDRVGRTTEDPLAVEPKERLLVRVGSQGEYTDRELGVYRDYVRCGGTLLLLSDGKGPGESDGLAQAFGLEVAGTVGGEALMDWFAPHPASEGLPPFPMQGGTGLLAWDEFAEPLGFLSEGSYLDLDGNGRRDPGEPLAAPALALRRYGQGTVVFLGSTQVVQNPDHPLLRHLLAHLFPDAPLPRPLPRDAFEPDDGPQSARPLALGGPPQERGFHSPSDADWVSLSLEEGQRARIFTTGPCDTRITLYGRDGLTVVAEDDDSGAGLNASAAYTATEEGTYYAQVRPSGFLGGACPAYRLAAQVQEALSPDVFEPDDGRTQARELTPGGPSQERSFHTEADVDWVAIPLSSGHRVRLSTAGSCDTLLRLHAPDGRQLARDDDSGPGRNASLVYTAPEDGTYYAQVQLSAAQEPCASYELKAELLPPIVADAFEPDDSPAQAKPLAPSAPPQQRTLHDEQDTDWVALQLAAGSPVRLFTLGSCDTFLTLYAPDGRTELARDDDSGPGFNAELTHTVREAGTYLAQVRSGEAPPAACESYQFGAQLMTQALERAVKDD